MATIQDRINDLGVMGFWAENPRIVQRGSFKGFTAWDVFIPKTKGLVNTLRVVFHMGPGHKGQPPDLETVLDCLFAEAADVENARDQGDYCLEYSCSPAVYKKAEAQRDSLKRWIGDDELFNACLWDTDNL